MTFTLGSMVYRAVGIALTALALAAQANAAEAAGRGADEKAGKEASVTNKVVKTDEEWRAILTPEQYRVLRRKGTEPAFCGLLWDHKEEGVYACVGCGQVIFSSATKFNSRTGWPSFWQPVSPDVVTTEVDRKFGMVRTEVLCSRCDGHLGHVFDDGPKPTGLRYCINSASLKFVPSSSP